MDLSVNEFVDGLLSEEAHNRSSDNGKVEDLEQKMQLPEWFDRAKFDQGRRFYTDFIFTLSINIMMSLMAVFAVPSITRILASTRRGNSPYTSYHRYVSTLMHFDSWRRYELKPGTKAWNSLLTVRTRHRRAGMEAKLRGMGTISQRDMAFTQSTLIIFVLLKPHRFSVRQLREGDLEGYIHFWRTIGHMIGLEDRYNICRKNVDETREVCRILVERVFRPCLENVPENFEHLARVTLGSMGLLNSYIETTSMLFMTKYHVDVPGFVYNETDRVTIQNKLKEHLQGKSEDTGVDPAVLIAKSAVDGLPKRPRRLLYVRDFDTVEKTPAYKQLNFAGRYRLAAINILLAIYNTDIGRYVLNLLYLFNLFLNVYFPYKAFISFGFRKSFVDIFREDPKDDTEPKPNSEYEKPPPPDTWYEKLFTIIWPDL